MMWKVEKCCCISLRAGTIAIAILGLAFNVLLFCLALIKPKDEYYDSESYKIFDTLSLQIIIPSTLIYVAVNTLLLMGALKGTPIYMLPWIILQGSLMVTYLYVILSLMIAIPQMLMALLGFPLGGYLWLIVFSHYRELKDASKSQDSWRLATPNQGGIYQQQPPTNPSLP